MTWFWFVIGVYLAGYLGAWRIGYSMGIAADLKQIDQENIAIRDYNKKVRRAFQHRDERFLTDEQHRDNVQIAALGAVIWPALALVVPAYWLVTRPTRAEKRHADRQVEREELDRLLKQAHDLGLPFPETDPTSKRNG